MTADIERLRALLEDIPLPLHWQASHLQGKAVDLKREHWLIGSAQTLQGLGLIFGNDSGLARLIVEAVNALPALLDEIERLRRCRYALEEALTPSAETKAAWSMPPNRCWSCRYCGRRRMSAPAQAHDSKIGGEG